MRVSILLVVGIALLATTVLGGRVAPKLRGAVTPKHEVTEVDMSTIDSSNIEQAFAEMAVHEQWNSFKSTYGKVYESPAHEAHRFTLFKQNLQIAAELHKKNPEATFGVNEFTDLHALEFKTQYLNYRPAVGDAALRRMNVPVTKSLKQSTVPASYDWRHPDQNRPVAVTAVKDQGQCGSCWAFSATEEVESAWILAGHQAVALSPEQTVDCDQVDQGCNGGDTVTAYAYMEGAGVQSEASYPYQAGNSGSAGNCNYDASKVVAKVTGFTYATPSCSDSCSNQNEGLLKQNLYNVAPASICVDASTWQTYTSGILTSASGCQSAYDALDHCVQLVGYGTDPSGTPFWSVRNSWATSWGEAGYIRLKYGENTCGVADEATFVQV
jgi:C1A family cysteine protease